MTCSRNGHIPVVGTIVCDIPCIPTRTGCSTGGCCDYLICMIGSSQLADGQRIGIGAPGTGTGQNTGCTGSRILGYLIGVAVAQSAAGGGTTGRTSLRCSTGCCRIAVTRSRDTRCEREATVGGGLPCPRIGTGGSTGRRLGRRSGVIRGRQCRQCDRGGARTPGTGTFQCTRRTGSRRFRHGVAVTVAQSAAGGGTTGGALLCHSTGSSRVAVARSRNALRVAVTTTGTGTGIGFDTRCGTGSRCGHLAGVAVTGGLTGINRPCTASIVPTADAKTVFTVSRDRQVSSLIPLTVPIVFSTIGIHTDKNDRRVAGCRSRTAVIAVPQ